MRSVRATGDPSADLTARARIRDAAIARFAADGVPGTTMRAIAKQAGVSAALVVHHFGSKDALRRACDEHVAATIRERKHEAMAQGGQLDPIAALRGATGLQDILRYLARTLGDGTPAVADLLDELVDDAVGYLDAGVASGLVKPSDDQRSRAAVLMLWSMGALVLHEHVRRLLGADLLGPADALLPYSMPALEILSRGVLDEGLYERARDDLAGDGAGTSPIPKEGP